MKTYVIPMMNVIEMNEADILRTSITLPNIQDPNETPPTQIG